MNARNHKPVPVVDSTRQQEPLSRLEQKNLLRHRLICLRKLSHSLVGERLAKVKSEMAELNQKIHSL